jgi:hypothetical protein
MPVLITLRTLPWMSRAAHKPILLLKTPPAGTCHLKAGIKALPEAHGKVRRGKATMVLQDLNRGCTTNKGRLSAITTEVPADPALMDVALHFSRL